MVKRDQITFHSPSPEDTEMLYRWRQDPVMRQFNPLANSTVAELKERLLKSSSNFSDYEKVQSFFWFIKINNEFAGNINCQNINLTMLNAELGYNIISTMRGRGIATQAVKWVTRNIFEQTPIRKLIAFVHEENIPSIKVLEKAGYRREGLLREHYLIQGVPANELIFGILKKEFTSD